MVTIRRVRQEDGKGIWLVHTQAIREICKRHYTSEEIEAWAGRLRPDSYLEVIKSREFFVAEAQGRIVGFGQLCLSTGEVEAIYIRPTSVRQGVGTQLLHFLEARAQESGLTVLHLDASLNAVPFYTQAGFEPQQEARHQLKPGVEIACIVMTKLLRAHSEGA